MIEVTDPSILDKLNSEQKEVTDPDVLKQLNADEKPSLLKRIASDFQDRQKQADIIKAAYASNQQGLPESTLQMAGTGAGFVGDALGQATVSAFNALPNAVQSPLRSLGSEAANSSVGKYLGSLASKYGQFEENNPRAARNINSVGNLAMMLTPASAPEKAALSPNGGVLSRLGESLVESGAKKSAADKTKFVSDLVKEIPSKQGAIDDVSSTVESGILKQKKVVPNKFEQGIIDEVSKVNGVSPSKTNQGNFLAIRNAAYDEAENLKKALVKNQPTFDRQVTNDMLDKISQGFEKNPALVGDAGTYADRLIGHMKNIVQEHPSTPAGLLEARKELDQWVKSQAGGGAFDPKLENAKTIAIRGVRQGINDFIAEKMPEAGVKNSLAKQSKLFSAMDNIAPKAAAEGNNVLDRAWKNVKDGTSLKAALISTLGIGGATLAGAAPVLAGLGAGGAGVYFGGKALTGAQARNLYGELLKNTDKLIQTAKDKKVIQQLRLDRAALKEMMQNTPQDEEK